MACTGGAITTNGMTVAIGPLTATDDIPGYDAVSYDVIGETIDPGVLDKNWSIASYIPTNGLDGRATVQKKTSYTRTPVTVTFGPVDGDAGQDAAELANDGDDCISIRYTRQNGAIIYFSSQVTQFTRAFPGDAFELGTITFLPQTDGIAKPAP